MAKSKYQAYETETISRDMIKNAIIEKISRRDDEIINMGAKIIEMWFTAHKDEMPEGSMEDCLTYFRQYVR